MFPVLDDSIIDIGSRHLPAMYVLQDLGSLIGLRCRAGDDVLRLAAWSLKPRCRTGWSRAASASCGC